MLRLKHLWSIWKKQARFTRRKYCRINTPDGNLSWGYLKTLPSNKWTGWETQPGHRGFGSLHSYLSMKTRPQALAVCCTLRSAFLPETTSLCPWQPQESKRRLWRLIRLFGSSTSSVVFAMIFSPRSLSISWRKDFQKGIFLKLPFLAKASSWFGGIQKHIQILRDPVLRHPCFSTDPHLLVYQSCNKKTRSDDPQSKCYMPYIVQTIS